jgi:3-isopropylmalate dehydrogenase
VKKAKKSSIAIFPGDGIGVEIIEGAKLVLEKIGDLLKLDYEIKEGLIGGASIDKHCNPLTQENIDLAKSCQAVLLGAVGGPKWESLDYSIRPERGLLAIRKELDLYANLRPVRLFSALANASTLKKEIISNLDLLVVRELIGGIYFGEPKGIHSTSNGEERGINTLTYTTSEISRIAHKAFQTARKRKSKVTSVDKANVLETDELWRKVVTRVHTEYPDVELNHMYVDNCAMQLIRNPKQFDVILTTNMFGDILSDEASMLTGSNGMLSSASLGDEHALYEPIHGSAPDIAGQNKANPIAMILSVAMMYRYSFDLLEAAEKIENAIEKVLEENYRTADIYEKGTKLLGTKEMSQAIIERIER